MERARFITPDIKKVLSEFYLCAYDEAPEREIDWGSGGHVHNWKSYISTGFKEKWSQLSDEARWLAYLFAELKAGDEHWD